MCAYSAIPSLIYYAASGNVTQNSIYELALTVATFIFITSRVFLTGNLIENKTSPTAIALMTASDLRDKEINPIPEKPEVIDVEGESLEPMIPEEDDTNQISLENEEMGISGEMLNNLEDEASEANIEVKSDDNESEITSES